MQIGVLGVNHKSAPLALREKVAEACQAGTRHNRVVVSTCHRTEIYFSHDDLAAAQSDLLTELKKRLPPSQEHLFYSYFGKECFLHLACVTAGLDSAMLGESDVQRQVKVAYEKQRLQGELSSPLHYLFQKSLHLGKKARSLFPFFQTTLHLEGMLYQLMENLLGASPRLLFIGNSDINRKMIHYFWRRGQRQMTLSTMRIEPATAFALDYQLSLKDRSEISQWHLYDGVIAATTSDNYLITTAPKAVHTRLILDLSVPRSVDPTLKRSPHTTLLNMEEIGRFFERYHSHHLSEVTLIQEFLHEAVNRYTALYERKSFQEPIPVNLCMSFSHFSAPNRIKGFGPYF
jgi:glutamyl-tRNA reductase